MRAVSKGRGGFLWEGMVVARRKAIETGPAKAGGDVVTEQGHRDPGKGRV